MSTIVSVVEGNILRHMTKSRQKPNSTRIRTGILLSIVRTVCIEDVLDVFEKAIGNNDAPRPGDDFRLMSFLSCVSLVAKEWMYEQQRGKVQTHIHKINRLFLTQNESDAGFARHGLVCIRELAKLSCTLGKKPTWK